MVPSGIEPEATSANEIAELFRRYGVARSDADAAGQSTDGRYIDAYGAGFPLAKIAVRAAGYRVKSGDNHHDTYLALPWVLGSQAKSSAAALDSARRKRNVDMYDAAGMVDAEDLRGLLGRVDALESMVLEWLREQHPEYAAAVSVEWLRSIAEPGEPSSLDLLREIRETSEQG